MNDIKLTTKELEKDMNILFEKFIEEMEQSIKSERTQHKKEILDELSRLKEPFLRDILKATGENKPLAKEYDATTILDILNKVGDFVEEI